MGRERGSIIISINVQILGSRIDKIILKRYMPDGKLGRVVKEKEREEKHCQLPYLYMFINILVDAYSKKF